MRRAKPTKANDSKTDLPPNVVAADLNYPSYDKGQSLGYQQLRELFGADVYPAPMVFYKTKGLGWVLTTLHISNPSRRQSAGTVARTYGIGVADQKVYTVGRGPHVEKEVAVYLSKANLERLTEYVELWKKGMADAGAIRDRISSRRAQGQLHRAAGRSYWDW
jgi:hypothetical protein